MALHQLLASTDTVRVGVIDRDHPPVLSIESGDELEMSTWGLWEDRIQEGMSFDDILAVRAEYTSGAHSMTGPVAVRGARPGQTLRVDILSLRTGPYGYNFAMPATVSSGVLANEFPDGCLRHFKLDRESGTTQFSDSIRLPLKPFLGIMGVAPAQAGPHNSTMPGVFGGNIDCAELVEGSTLYLPVFQPGALFYAGDAHAVQGHGEVNGTAIETSMESARLRLTTVPDMALQAPCAETATHWISLDFGKTLEEAARKSLSAMVHWLVDLHGISPAEAYCLCSLQGDLIITQAVNRICGVHTRFPKSVFA